VQGLRKGDLMTEEIRLVEHYSASILNKVGEGTRVLGRCVTQA
jgi:hypothetical protein